MGPHLMGDPGPSSLATQPCPTRFQGRGGISVCHGKEDAGVYFRRASTRRQGNNGFTLVELLIAMAVILTLAALAVPNLMAALDQARIARAVGDIDTLEDEIALYQTINGRLPDDLSQIGYGNYPDPWGNPYQYLNHSTMKGNGKARKDRFLVPLNSDYDLYSMGKDGKSQPPITSKDSQDDIIRASNGSYVGLASQF